MKNKNKEYRLQEIASFIRDDYQVEGNRNAVFSSIDGLEDAGSQALVWCSPKKENREELIRQTKAAVVICDNQLP
jgi:UDP-3-O-[3-hydroxymyristoyl] glucosamine N-acyltransferase